MHRPLSDTERKDYGLSISDRRQARKATGVVWKAIAFVVSLGAWIGIIRILPYLLRLLN